MTEQPGQYPPPQQPYPYPPPGGPQPPQYGHPGYPPPPPGYVYPQQPYAQPYPQQPLPVHQVGMSVTKPAWTVGDILWILFTAGLAWPIIWLKRRSRTTVTRHR